MDYECILSQFVKVTELNVYVGAVSEIGFECSFWARYIAPPKYSVRFLKTEFVILRLLTSLAYIPEAKSRN